MLLENGSQSIFGLPFAEALPSDAMKRVFIAGVALLECVATGSVLQRPWRIQVESARECMGTRLEFLEGIVSGVRI